MTAQVGDKIFYKGNEFRLASEPLEPIVSTFSFSGELYFGTYFHSGSTANHRGYIASWEIKHNRLFLIDISPYGAMTLFFNKDGSCRTLCYGCGLPIDDKQYNVLYCSKCGQPTSQKSFLQCYSHENRKSCDTEEYSRLDFKSHIEERRYNNCRGCLTCDFTSYLQKCTKCGSMVSCNRQSVPIMDGFCALCGNTKPQDLEQFDKTEHVSPILASWFTGTIRIPDGKRLAYVHMGYDSIYEKNILIDIHGGVVIGEEVIDGSSSKPNYHAMTPCEILIARVALDSYRKSKNTDLGKNI